ncbi:DUF3024 domain-containing protein [Aquimarina agarivorans]|uniref:DUF3024 domain-containing protein n=1 Tax=Aquimarina agarivorans TaxID=980584 RepID=UPI000248EB52|nr:DUF3024 domain-containing protein [Aquimarina agarivorans]
MDASKIVDFNKAIIDSFIEELRPPAEKRDQIDIGYKLVSKAYEFSEIRPDWMDASKKMEFPFAKIRYVKSQKVWKLYWMHSSGEWELYPELSDSESLQEVLQIIKEDKLHCFFG